MRICIRARLQFCGCVYSLQDARLLFMGVRVVKPWIYVFVFCVCMSACARTCLYSYVCCMCMYMRATCVCRSQLEFKGAHLYESENALNMHKQCNFLY